MKTFSKQLLLSSLSLLRTFTIGNTRYRRVNITMSFGLTVMCLLLLGSCVKVEDTPLASGSQENLTGTFNKMNIILILADDVGFEVPQVDGGRSYSTPNINKLASQGIRFINTFSTPLCSPSRFELLTGKYNFRNYGVWGVMDTTNRTIANMLRDAGYNTLVAGKWQLDGGDASIHALGFNDYMVFNPFANSNIGNGSRYKNPTLYQFGKLLNKDSMNGKYGDDVVVNYINNWIDTSKNKRRPMFIYYPVMLCHAPFSPTPEDPEFATWEPAHNNSDPSFFPSMAEYMDEKIGQVVDHVTAAGLANNTIIIYVGDNGTDDKIFSLFKNKTIQGGKSYPWFTGTKQEMIVSAPGLIAPNQINSNLVDFTDFLPTFADIAGVPKPTTYGKLDGVSFYPNLVGQVGTPRGWVFCHYDQNEQGEGRHPIQRWINNRVYKLYDTTGMFYNIKTDAYELHPLADSSLTAIELKTKQHFQNILNKMHN
jgi:arylsulfatase A